jgi:hypothetical protein
VLPAGADLGLMQTGAGVWRSTYGLLSRGRSLISLSITLTASTHLMTCRVTTGASLICGFEFGEDERGCEIPPQFVRRGRCLPRDRGPPSLGFGFRGRIAAGGLRAQLSRPVPCRIESTAPSPPAAFALAGVQGSDPMTWSRLDPACCVAP